MIGQEGRGGSVLDEGFGRVEAQIVDSVEAQIVDSFE
jgi:hypothetical protein